MIEDARGRIEYEEQGSGPTLVMVPGSCSTGAAWRPVIKALDGNFRFVTTSLLGYGETAERRTESDPSVLHEAEMLEAVIRKAGGNVHLVGHSFGGAVALDRRHAQACADRQPDGARSAAAVDCCSDCREDAALPLLPRHDGRLFRGLSRRRPGSDRER